MIKSGRFIIDSSTPLLCVDLALSILLYVQPSSLVLLFIVNILVYIHYMCRPNWPSSCVQIGFAL
jgi:hypothetical protein